MADENIKKAREQAAEAKRQRREAVQARRFEQENQPRDDEEKRNAEAEDKNAAENFNAILKATAGMSDAEFKAYLDRNKRAVRKAGGKSQVQKADKSRKSWFGKRKKK